VLAEDLFLLRDGLARTLTEHGFTVIAAVDNGPSLRQALTNEQADTLFPNGYKVVKPYLRTTKQPNL